MRKNQYSSQEREAGLVSIIVTIVIVIVLSLITLGFARLVRREQRQVIDRQLSSQAFYAAETGINDAVKAITSQNYKGINNDGNKTQCNPDPGGGALSGTSNVIDAASNVAYPCLLINETPPTLEFSPVSTDKSTYVALNSSNGVPFSRLRISWQSPSGSTNFRAALNKAAAFPPVNNWLPSQTGVLRVALTPLASLTRDDLIYNTFTTFLYPLAGGAGGFVSYAGGAGNIAQQGQIIGGQCASGATPRFCNVEITGLSEVHYFLRLKSMYNPSTVTITAFDAANNQLAFSGGQAQIDSTGKAQDVLRRIQVRLPLTNSYNFPEFAIDSGDSICKRLQVAPPNYASSDDTLDPACKLD